MSGEQDSLKSATGKVLDSNTVKTFEAMDTLKPDDVVVIIHIDDYNKSFKMMMERINEMDEKVEEQSEFIETVKIGEKGFLDRFRIRKS